MMSREGFDGTVGHENIPVARPVPRDSVEVLRIGIVSPKDCGAERHVTRDVVAALNHSSAADRGLRLETVMWETDAYPALHEQGPQGICDVVADGCHLVVGIFWTRFGTQTLNGKTGTEHEVANAFVKWREAKSPQLMMFFNSQAAKLDDFASRLQWAQVAAFKDSLPKEGFYWEYDGCAHFEREFRRCLENYLKHTYPLQTAQNGCANGTSISSVAEAGPTKCNWTSLTIDGSVPNERVPEILDAFSMFARRCGQLGIDVRLSGNPHLKNGRNSEKDGNENA